MIYVYKNNLELEEKNFGYDLSKPIEVKNNFEINEEQLLSYIKEDLFSRFSFFNLKEGTIIAGGYVLNKILNYIQKETEIKTRDIDIFIPMSIESAEDVKDKDFDEWLKSTGDLYCFYVKADTYEILSQEKNGFINYIKYTGSHGFRSQELIDDFDLNCAQCGIIYKEQKWQLYLSEHFKYFLKSFSIDILKEVNLRSIARAFRKQEQYPFLTYDKYFYYNILIYEIFIKKTRLTVKDLEFKEMKIRIGKDNFRLLEEKFKNFSLILNKEYIQLDYSFYNEDFLKVLNRVSDLFYIKNKALLSKKEISFCYKVDNLTYSLEHGCKDFIFKMIIKFHISQESQLKKEINFLEKVAHKINSNICLSNILVSIKKMESYNEAKSFIRTIIKNKDIVNFFKSYNLSEFEEDLDSLTKIKLCRNNILKNKYNYIYEVLKINHWTGKYIKELASEEDLRQESKELQHCVVNYWDRVISGKERIFSLKIKDKRSTISIVCKDRLFNITQHKAYKNKKPSDIEIEFTNYFVKMLNKNYNAVDYFRKDSLLDYEVF